MSQDNTPPSNTMTKAQELQILTDAVKALGAHSYTGQWLKDQMPFIEGAIASDMPVETRAMSIREAQAQADDMIAAARAHRDEVTRQCEQMMASARVYAADTKDKARADAKAWLRAMADKM